MNEIRQAHIKIDREVDVDRGYVLHPCSQYLILQFLRHAKIVDTLSIICRTGIVHFNDACDNRHVNASLVQAQLKDTMAINQVLLFHYITDNFTFW